MMVTNNTRPDIEKLKAARFLVTNASGPRWSEQEWIAWFNMQDDQLKKLILKECKLEIHDLLASGVLIYKAQNNE